MVTNLHNPNNHTFLLKYTRCPPQVSQCLLSIIGQLSIIHRSSIDKDSQSKLPTDTKFTIPQISNESVLKFLSNIDINKATGTDMIGPRLLKLAAPYITDEITFICNHSITTSVFPSKWKEAKVAPLHKKGSHEEVNNYCPISILPVLSKVLEKHVHESLSDFLHQHTLLHKTQSGFRAKHLCETALTNMIDLWLNAIDNGQMIGVVLVDFKKAFDLVDHRILLNKLEIYGIKDEALLWFNTYLTNRKQQVNINNNKSDLKNIYLLRCSSGVYFRTTSIFTFYQ